MNALFPPPGIPTTRLRVLLLSAGVQSTTFAQMAAQGKVGPIAASRFVAPDQTAVLGGKATST